MRERKSEREATSFQEGGPYDPSLDIKTDVAMVYGMDSSLADRIQGWKDAGYIVHVMVGVSWGHYQDYVRGEWDGQTHYDDAQASQGDFKLEHGVSQGSDIFYMVPTQPYIAYLLERLCRVIDAGAAAIHLEEPEFWVRGGYGEGFKREWRDYYGTPWEDPVSSPPARYRTAVLQQFLYTRAIDILCRGLKAYAVSKQIPDFRCYVPTHSLLNYAHWRIVSPESQLAAIPDVDGLIAQVWTGTARTRTMYQGRLKERTFEAAYCEYGSMVSLLRGTNKRLWLLADPIEDDPNHSWEDYRHHWQATVTASLLFTDVSRYEVVPWPRRVFKMSYPRTDTLRDVALRDVVNDYVARLQARGQQDLAEATRDVIGRFERFCASQNGKTPETLGFAASPIEGELRFSNVLTYLFDFYQHLYATETPLTAARLRDAIAAFHHNPTEERETIPSHYATELQVVFNALADMAWDETSWDHDQPAVGLCLSDTLMYGRGAPAPGDEHLSSVYGLALPLIKHGLPLHMISLERIVTSDSLSTVRLLLLSYEGIKPITPQIHVALAEWVKAGGVLIFFGSGDAYNGIEAWWNIRPHTFESPQQHLFELLGAQPDATTAYGHGWVKTIAHNPSVFAYENDGAERVRDAVREACQLLKTPWHEQNTLVLRRGPYVIAAGMAETESLTQSTTLYGCYVNLYDSHLTILRDPIIHAETHWLLYDMSSVSVDKAWVIAASGRVDQEVSSASTLHFEVSGAEDTNAAVRVRLPRPPQTIAMHVNQVAHRFFHEWEEGSQTLFLHFAAQSRSVCIDITF